MTGTKKQAAIMAVRKLSFTAKTRYGEHRLMFAIIERAILDIGGHGAPDDEMIESAKRLLEKEEIPYAAACGLDSDYIRRVLRQYQLI